MLFVPPSIPYMVPEAEAADNVVMISSSGFSVTSLNIEMSDTITFMSTTSVNWIIFSEGLLGGQHVIRSEGTTWLGLNCWGSGEEATAETTGVFTVTQHANYGDDLGLTPLTVTINCPDTTPPVVAVFLTNISNSTSNPAGKTIPFTVLASDNVGVASGPTCSPAGGSTFPIGSTTVTCIATDAAGNVGTESFTITITLEGAADTTPPFIEVNELLIGPDKEGNEFFEQTVNDGDNIIFNTAEFDVFTGVDPVPVTFKTSTNDPGGGSVHDADCETDGGWSMMGPSTIETTDSYIVSIYSMVVFSGNLAFSEPNIPTITCSTQDAAGNPASMSFTVTVVSEGPDTTPPVLSLVCCAMSGDTSENITRQATNSTGLISYNQTFSILVTDDVGFYCCDTLMPDGDYQMYYGARIGQYHNHQGCSPAGYGQQEMDQIFSEDLGWSYLFPIGVTTVTCSAADAAGNVGTLSFTVTVLGPTEAPTLTATAYLNGTSPTGRTIGLSQSDITALDEYYQGDLSLFAITMSKDNVDLSFSSVTGVSHWRVDTSDYSPSSGTVPIPADWEAGMYVMDWTGWCLYIVPQECVEISGTSSVTIPASPAQELGLTVVPFGQTDGSGGGDTYPCQDQFLPVFAGVNCTIGYWTGQWYENGIYPVLQDMTLNITNSTGIPMFEYALPRVMDENGDDVGSTSCSPWGEHLPVGTTVITCTYESITANYTIHMVDTSCYQDYNNPCPTTMTATAYLNSTSSTGRTLNIEEIPANSLCGWCDLRIIGSWNPEAATNYGDELPLQQAGTAYTSYQLEIPTSWSPGTYTITTGSYIPPYVYSISTITIPALPGTESAETEIVIPSWIKNNAGWWASNQIDDRTFVSGLQWLISNGIMNIPPTVQGAGSDDVIPSWIKNNAEWWADDLIDDRNFVTGLQWLITNGIMIIELE